jgi:concanavalin A-like lectin/glucanase superfamily protein
MKTLVAFLLRNAARFTLAAALLAMPLDRASAQPFGKFLHVHGPASEYMEVPSSPALNPTDAFTFEAWVLVTTTSGIDCNSIAGKNYLQAWWVGICGTTLRSYLKGGGSRQDGGTISPVSNQWTHIAVVYDGVHRLHYVNGEVTLDVAETGPLTASTDPVRIGSDVSWQHTPAGYIEEARIWNVARTQDQIRAGLMKPLAGPAPGLQAAWSFADTTADQSGNGHDGTLSGAPTYSYYGTNPLNCAFFASSTDLCLSNRFQITAKFRTGAPGTAEGIGQVVTPPGSGSGLFWFFTSDNWEVMLKSLNGCGLNSRWWLFSAATTNVFYRLDVFDWVTGAQRIYFNYPGPPAPAVTDTDAFATCP